MRQREARERILKKSSSLLLERTETQRRAGGRNHAAPAGRAAYRFYRTKFHFQLTPESRTFGCTCRRLERNCYLGTV